jgi:SAM-dependent methyltransferase/uncharacterized coiled-coil DUF342 family protein
VSRSAEDDLSLRIEERERQMLVPDEEYASNKALDFTGERFMPQQTDPLLALEHYHRYCFVSRFAENRRVLDIACGEGYGSAFLAQYAREVIGIDSDRTTIDHATHKYSSVPNLTFKIGRCEDLHEDLGGFDLVVSYETIEHLTENDQIELLNNVERILKKDGIFIVSSPDKDEYAAAIRSKNQFHKHEMTLAELKSRLETHFKYVYLCGQRILSLSAIWQLKGWESDHFHFYAKKDLLKEVGHGKNFSPPLYLIALCSNDPLPDDIIAEANSFYFDIANIEKTKNFYEWAAQMDAEAQKSREVVQNLQRQLEERANWAQDLQSEIDSRSEVIDSLRKELEKRATWAQDLQGEIDSRSEVIDSLRKELEERATWAQDLQSEIDSRNEVIDSLRKELEERATWAQDLQNEIKSRSEVIDSLRKEFEERTRWALSLDAEIARERAYSAQLDVKLKEETKKLDETTQRMKAIASSPVYRLLKKARLLPAAWGER